MGLAKPAYEASVCIAEKNNSIHSITDPSLVPPSKVPWHTWTWTWTKTFPLQEKTPFKLFQGVATYFSRGSAVSPCLTPPVSHLLELRFALALLHVFLQIFGPSRPQASDCFVGGVGAQHLPPEKQGREMPNGGFEGNTYILRIYYVYL